MIEDRDRIREAVKNAYPSSKPGAWAVWAGVLSRFAYEMQIGDVVVAPYRADRTLNFGQVVGPYEHHDVPRQPHRRRVEWLRTGVPRGLFPQSALNEIGAAVTMFRVRNHEDIFRRFLESASEETFERHAGTTSGSVEAVATLALRRLFVVDRAPEAQ